VRGRRPAARLFAHDRALGERRVAGTDEAGRGCLAGPLVVAAVCLDLEGLSHRARRSLSDLDDSKRLAPDVRARVADAILRHAEQVVVLVAGAATIDRDGLHRTNLRLLARALAALEPCPSICLVDGFRLGPHAPEHRAVVGGDRRSACIAAASVIAKTARDRLMAGPVADAYPGFGFDQHVGYATPEHHAALRAGGLSPVHRRSFQSVAYPPLWARPAPVTRPWRRPGTPAG
jgi:ribonuclease HII